MYRETHFILFKCNLDISTSSSISTSILILIKIYLKLQHWLKIIFKTLFISYDGLWAMKIIVEFDNSVAHSLLFFVIIISFVTFERTVTVTVRTVTIGFSLYFLKKQIIFWKNIQNWLSNFRCLKTIKILYE